MHRVDGRIARLERFIAAWALALALLFLGGIVSAETQRDPRIIRTSRIEAPANADPRVFLPPPTAFDAAQAREQLDLGLGQALDAARRSVPLAPWNRWGLARVAIDLEMARLDPERSEYFVDLPDGRRAWLTLDAELQERMRTFLARYPDEGQGLAAIEPGSGRVVALLSGGQERSFRTRLALSDWPVTASLFKVVTGAAFLEHGVARAETVTCYEGGRSSISLEQLTPRHGESRCRTLVEAMAHSSNLVFARLADQHLDPGQLRAMADRFAFNSRIPFESELGRHITQIPDDRLGYARAAAGFGDTHTSPLHTALIFAAIANEGTMMVPTLVDRIEDADGRVLYRHTPQAWREVLTPRVNAQLVDLLSTTAVTGTAASEFARRSGWPDDLRVWGKTGTLSRTLDTRGERFLLRWFGGFARRGEAQVAFGSLSVCGSLWHATGNVLASELVLRALP